MSRLLSSALPTQPDRDDGNEYGASTPVQEKACIFAKEMRWGLGENEKRRPAFLEGGADSGKPTAHFNYYTG